MSWVQTTSETELGRVEKQGMSYWAIYFWDKHSSMPPGHTWEPRERAPRNCPSKGRKSGTLFNQLSFLTGEGLLPCIFGQGLYGVDFKKQLGRKTERPWHKCLEKTRTGRGTVHLSWAETDELRGCGLDMPGRFPSWITGGDLVVWRTEYYICHLLAVWALANPFFLQMFISPLIK